MEIRIIGEGSGGVADSGASEKQREMTLKRLAAYMAHMQRDRAKKIAEALIQLNDNEQGSKEFDRIAQYLTEGLKKAEELEKREKNKQERPKQEE